MVVTSAAVRLPISLFLVVRLDREGEVKAIESAFNIRELADHEAEKINRKGFEPLANGEYYRVSRLSLNLDSNELAGKLLAHLRDELFGEPDDTMAKAGRAAINAWLDGA